MIHKKTKQGTATMVGRANRRRSRAIWVGIAYVVLLGACAAAGVGLVMHIPHAKEEVSAAKPKSPTSSGQSSPVIIVQQTGCRQAEFDNSNGRLTDSEPVSCNDISFDLNASGNRLENIKQGFFGRKRN